MIVTFKVQLVSGVVNGNGKWGDVMDKELKTVKDVIEFLEQFPPETKLTFGTSSEDLLGDYHIETKEIDYNHETKTLSVCIG